MKVALIVAVSENGVIGKDNNLIWHLPKDMNFFKENLLVFLKPLELVRKLCWREDSSLSNGTQNIELFRSTSKC